MKKHLIFRCIVILCFSLCFITAVPIAQAQRGMKTITVRTQQGEAIELYKNSYALVIGNGNYTEGWSWLPGALEDVDEVADALEEHSFSVTLKKDLTKLEFDKVFADFVVNAGAGPDNRLLFYYAGHGYTEKMANNEDLGYLVMVDASLPEKDAINFKLKAMDMASLMTQAKLVQSRHVLFVFDSCFAGTILNLRAKAVPKHISDRVKHPVRQFITAGRANEQVPDRSVFKQEFLDLIQGRAKDPFPDGYITGAELGEHLASEVPNYNNGMQNPQYGKIMDPQLNKGDFVFVLPKGPAFTSLPEERPTIATLTVTSIPSGADIYVDNVWMGKTPLVGYKVDTGIRQEKQVKVDLELSGYKDHGARLTLRGGKQTPWDVRLEKFIPRTGTLTVTSTPSGASVYVDGDLIGTTPLSDYGIDTGAAREKQVEVGLELLGYKSQVTRLTLRGGKQTPWDVRLEKFIPRTGTLTVTSTPSGASVYVDGDFIGTTPLNNYKIDTGAAHEKQVKVDLELSGYKDHGTRLTLRGGRQTPWDVRLEKFIPRTGTLTVTSTPSGASVYIDGDLIGTTPLNNYEIDTGAAHEKQVKVDLELSGYKSQVTRLTLRGGKQTPWDVRLEKFIPRTGTLTVTSTPSGASVYIDGDLIGTTPLSDYGIDTGAAREKQVEIHLELSGYKSLRTKLTLTGGQSTPWEAHFEKIPQIQKETVPSDAASEGMVLILAGKFQMGSNGGSFDEKPVHTVYVDAFDMDAYEVTNAQYKKFVDANPQWGKDDIPSRYHDGNYLKHWTRNSHGRGDHPVVYVSWYAAMAYAEWAGKRLPTEAEWEKAARGGLLGKKYPWGDLINSSKAAYDVGGTTDVGTYPPNNYGLYDMAGNVWEWCLDEYQGDYYKISRHRNPIGRVNSITDITSNFTNIKKDCVLRGGSWVGNPRSLRVADRRGNAPTFTNPYFGFRCARTVSP